MSEQELDRLRLHFSNLFRGESAEIVLKHLEEFCSADNADYCQDARLDAYLQGRRSVYLEIYKLINHKEER